MTIVKMKRLRLVSPSADKRSMLRELTRYGCVEIESGDRLVADPEWQDFLNRENVDTIPFASQATEVSNALAALKNTRL